MIVHRRLPEFEGGSVRSWLYAMCIRVASEHRRRAHVRRETSTAAPQLSTPASQFEETEQREVQEQLFRVLSDLDDDKREAFILYEIEELTLREIAEKLGNPLQTVYSQLQSARKHVTEAFQTAQQENERRSL